VKQTGIAMAQMDTLSQRNNVVAQQVSGSAEDLETQAQRLYRIMQASRVLVLGAGRALRTSGVEGSGDVIDDLVGNTTPPQRSSGKPASVHEHSEAPSPRRKSTSPDTSGLLSRLKARKSDAVTDSRNSGSSGAPFGTSASPHTSPSSHANASSASENSLSSVDVSADDDSFRAA
jgi:hypothetical protein